MNNEAQAGWDAMQAQARKTAAYNALRKQYGDIAGDPEAANQLQKYGFDQQNNPLLLQGNALANQGAQQKIEFDQQDDPLRLQGDQDKLDNNKIVQQGNQLDVDAKQRQAQQQHAQMLHGVFSGTLDGLEKEGSGMVDPAQRAALFDRHAATLTSLTGMDDAATQAELAKEKQRFVDGGTEAIPGMRADLDAATQAVMTPEQKQAQALGNIKLQTAQANQTTAQAKADAAKAKAAGAGTGATLSGPQLDKTVLNYTKVYGKPEQIAASIGAVKTFDDKLTLLLGSGAQGDDKNPDKVKSFGNDGLIQQAIDLTKKLQGQNKYQVALQSHIKGTDAYNLQQALDQISHSAALTDLQNLKANGTSLGRVTNAEFLAASQAIINADPTAKTGTLITQLNKLGDMYMGTHNAALKMAQQRQGDLDGWHKLVKGTIYGNPNDPAEAPDAAPAGVTVPAPGLTSPAPGGAAGAGVTPPAAATPNSMGTVTPQQLQEQGVLTPDQTSAPATQQPAGVQNVSLPADGQPQPRIIPNFVASPSLQPLQAALANPSVARQLPAGMRNNNPGNIKYVHQAGTTPSANTDEGDPQAVYATPQAGMNAMSALLQRKFNGGKVTPDQMIADNGGWTPGNHDAAANVARTMGIGPNDQMNFNDPMQKAKFMRALMLQEHGPKSRLYPDSMVYAAVGAQPPQGGDQQAPLAPPDQQTVASAAPAGGGQVQDVGAPAGGQQAPGAPQGMQQMADATPRGDVAKGAQNAGAQLQGMTPMQVATTPVALPSAMDVGRGGVAQQAEVGNAFNRASGGGVHVATLGDVNSILARYGLRKKA